MNKNYHLSVIGSIGSLEKYLNSIEGWFQNIQKQTMFRWTEHIIIYTKWHKIFDKYTHLDNIFFYQETGKGVYNAWNEGIKKSTTKIVTNWNIDDRRYPKANEKKYIILKKKSDIGLVYNWLNVTTIENDTIYNPQGMIGMSRRLPPEDINWFKKSQCGPDPMWRKELHNICGYFDGENFPISADWDMWIAIHNISKLYMIKEPLCLYYHNPNGVSTSDSSANILNLEIEKIWEKYAIN